VITVHLCSAERALARVGQVRGVLVEAARVLSIHPGPPGLPDRRRREREPAICRRYSRAVVATSCRDRGAVVIEPELAEPAARESFNMRVGR
jgi:hypothetical protein